MTIFNRRKKRIKQFVKDDWVFAVDLMLDDFISLKKKVDVEYRIELNFLMDRIEKIEEKLKSE